jgi:hypothetical protein
MSYKDINPVPVNDNSHIIGPAYNGRVNLIEQPSVDVLFAMQEKIGIRNKATEFREALTGIWESTTLSKLYFSSENIQIIQNGLRAGVYQLSDQKYIIAPQNIETLKIIMRSIYLQHSENRADNITGQIERLNKLVLDYAVPAVYGEAVGYEKYCHDQSTLVVPLQLPQQSDRDHKQLLLQPFM